VWYYTLHYPLFLPRVQHRLQKNTFIYMPIWQTCSQKLRSGAVYSTLLFFLWSWYSVEFQWTLLPLFEIFYCPHGLTETCGRPGQVNKFAPLQTDIFQKFIQYLFIGGWEKLISYWHSHFASYVRSDAWKTELTGAVFPIYSCNILSPSTGWHPGQLPGSPAPQSDYRNRKYQNIQAIH
jgi:hypothetical protein